MCCGPVAHAHRLPDPRPVTLIADDEPAWVEFQPPRERWFRYWAPPLAWSAVYRIALEPGWPYQLLVAHDGDPARLRATVTDEYPFAPVHIRFVVPLHHLGVHRPSRQQIYGARFVIPPEAAVPGVHVLLEWLPRGRRDRPPPVLIGMVVAADGTLDGGRAWAESDWDLRSPLEAERQRAPYVVPLPRMR